MFLPSDVKLNVKSGRQECPPHIRNARVAEESSPEHRLEQPDGQHDGVEMLSADTSWSHALREGCLGDCLGIPSIFKPSRTNLTTTATAGRNYWCTARTGVSARFTLELDTDLGLVPTKTAFERKLVSPES